MGWPLLIAAGRKAAPGCEGCSCDDGYQPSRQDGATSAAVQTTVTGLTGGWSGWGGYL